MQSAFVHLFFKEVIISVAADRQPLSGHRHIHLAGLRIDDTALYGGKVRCIFFRQLNLRRPVLHTLQHKTRCVKKSLGNILTGIFLHMLFLVL